MNLLATPVDAIDLVARMNALTPYQVPRSTLIALFQKSAGNKVTSILSVETFNEWFKAIQFGRPFEFVESGKGSIKPMSYSIESDDVFKFINFTAYDKFDTSSFTLLGFTIALESNSNNVYIDSKSAFPL